MDFENCSLYPLKILFSNLNKEVEPSALESIASRNEVIYPALLVSLIFNLLTGGFVIKVLAPMFTEMLGTNIFLSVTKYF